MLQLFIHTTVDGCLHFREIVFSWGVVLLPRGHWRCLETFLVFMMGWAGVATGI